MVLHCLNNRSCRSPCTFSSFYFCHPLKIIAVGSIDRFCMTQFVIRLYLSMLVGLTTLPNKTSSKNRHLVSRYSIKNKKTTVIFRLYSKHIVKSNSDSLVWQCLFSFEYRKYKMTVFRICAILHLLLYQQELYIHIYNVTKGNPQSTIHVHHKRNNKVRRIRNVASLTRLIPAMEIFEVYWLWK